MDFFAVATTDLDRALGEALRTQYPLLMHLVRVDAALRHADADSLEEAARRAIIVALGWDESRKRAEIDRFVEHLTAAWPTQMIRYERMRELCTAAKSELPAWVQTPHVHGDRVHAA